MKRVPLLLLAVGAAGFMAPSPQTGEPWTFILGGDTDGYLSPCGCTKPMSGGIRRRATAVETLRVKDRTVLLENGGLVSGSGRQDELKAEALAESLGGLSVDAIHYGPSEAKLGAGALLSLAQLSGGRLVTSHLRRPTEELSPVQVAGPFVIGAATTAPGALAGLLGEPPLSTEAAVQNLIEVAADLGATPVLMLQGDEARATALAQKFPKLALILYRSSGDPPAAPKQVGGTLLVTPGEKNKHLVRVRYQDGRWSGYLPVRLSPEFHDHDQVSRFYRTYLKRVDEEGLLDKLPRAQTPKFVGSKACGKCHSEAMKVLEGTTHFRALETLEKDFHNRDPDCVGCHVTGLESVKGFRSRAATPDLAHVGCESCHGPGADHAAAPFKVKLPQVGETSCLKCHTGDTSPKFDFAEYWARVRHN
ncbi:MAG TPA: multiheme c-type cytochrome [Fimbriimonadaceae bacterium]|nr:multiheme c-type cytochrome [Fimbriimonadaceae bacterium]